MTSTTLPGPLTSRIHLLQVVVQPYLEHAIRCLPQKSWSYAVGMIQVSSPQLCTKPPHNIHKQQHIPSIQSSHSFLSRYVHQRMSHAAVPRLLAENISLLALHLQPSLGRVDRKSACTTWTGTVQFINRSMKTLGPNGHGTLGGLLATLHYLRVTLTYFCCQGGDSSEHKMLNTHFLNGGKNQTVKTTICGHLVCKFVILKDNVRYTCSE